jgi:hypothetical protein
MVSQVLDVDGTLNENMGKAPHGYLVLTPTRFVSFYTGDTRKFGTSVAEKAALFDTVTGWSGMYRVEGGKIIVAVDASWTEIWNGKEQVRNWELKGNQLTLSAGPMPFPRDPSKTVIVRQVWEKIAYPKSI